MVRPKPKNIDKESDNTDISEILNKLAGSSSVSEVHDDVTKCNGDHIAPITADTQKDIYSANETKDPLRLVLESLDIADTLKGIYDEKIDKYMPKEYNKFTDLLLSEQMIALLLNLGCLQADKGKAYKYLEFVSGLVMNNGTSNDIRITWNNSDEETDISNWNKKVEEYNDSVNKETKDFKEVVAESPLLSDEEKIQLLGMNELAIKELIKKLKKMED